MELSKKKAIYAGKFVLLSSNDFEVPDIIPIYYERRRIEEVFDMAKTYTNLLPLKEHSNKTFRGILLLNFLATATYASLSLRLKDSHYSAKSALTKTFNLKIKIYDSAVILSELTKEQKEIFQLLELDCPFKIEKGTRLKKKSLIDKFIKTKNPQGRPKGTKKKPEADSAPIMVKLPGKRQRGRPKGAKNKPVLNSTTVLPLNHAPKRQRGRPKGTKRKR
jgi:hypothetical protein